MKKNRLITFILSGLLSLFCFSDSGYAQVYVSVQINQAQTLQADAGAHQTICIGDSIQLGGSPAAWHGNPPYAYAWSPVTGLSNTGAANPFASPAATTAYLLTVTDSLGCTAVDSTVVVIDSCIGMAEIMAPISIDIYPNPNNGTFTVALESGQTTDNITIYLINKLGQVVHFQQERGWQSPRLIEVDAHSLSKGLYFFLIRSESICHTGKVIIE